MKIELMLHEICFIRIQKIRALRGANIWCRETALECWVEFPSCHHVQDLWQSYLSVNIPKMIPKWNLSEASPGALAAVLLAIAQHLQSDSEGQVSNGQVVPNSQPDLFRIIIPYKEEQIARMAFGSACSIVEAALKGQNFDFAPAMETLRKQAYKICLGPSTLAIVEAARARHIPVARQTEGSLVQLGWGSKQKKILAAATSHTSALAENIAQDKELTRQLLYNVGLNVPAGRPVISEEDAWMAALEIGLPVVVKPRDGNQGRGVTLKLFTKEHITAAYHAARKESESIIIEQFVQGEHYRLLIVDEELIAASHCQPAHVIGDGIQTIQQLVEEVNRDPLRAPDHAMPLSKINIDAIALSLLSEQGMTIDSIPEEGKKVLIRLNSNLSTGGTAIDVTDVVHATIRMAAIEAAQIVGLNICGIDIIAQDIERPLSKDNGTFIEINARPGLRMHHHPMAGKPRPAGQAIIETLFAPGENGRIPIVAITGVNGKTTTTRFITHLLTQPGCVVGMCNSEGIFAGRRILEKGDCSGPKSARHLLSDPFVDIAVLETARGGILREGLAFDHCDVAVVTNIGSGDHLGIDEIDTPQQLARIKECIVKAVPPSGSIVLNANEPLVVKMAESCACQTIFFANQNDNAIIQQHRKQGKLAIFTRQADIILAEGNREFIFLPLKDVPLTGGGLIPFHIENTLASVAAAWALGIDIDHIRQRVRSFTSSIDNNRGRFNIFNIGGATAVIDCVHNIDALHAMLAALNTFPHQLRKAMYSFCGDRRDSDIIEQGRLLGLAFDEIWIYEGYYMRGRKFDEIKKLMAHGLEGATRTKRVEYIQGQLKAIDRVLETISPRDLVMIQTDRIDEILQHLKDKHSVSW